MSGQEIAVIAGVVTLVVVASFAFGEWQLRRTLRQFDRETAAVVASVSPTVPEPLSWSEAVGWDPAEQLRTIARQAADEAWQERMVADLTGPAALPFLTELAGRYLAEPQRELVAS